MRLRTSRMLKNNILLGIVVRRLLEKPIPLAGRNPANGFFPHPASVLGRDPFPDNKSNPLASASAQGRRRAARAQSLAILHKVGCSWTARAKGTVPSSSAGPTTPPRFELKGTVPLARPSGEPTVSHEGCSGSRLVVRCFVLEEESNPLASASAQGRRRAARAQSLAILHKVGCSWTARPGANMLLGSAGPTTPLRFEPNNMLAPGLQSGEPTVSHEGCSGPRLLLRFVSHVASVPRG